MSRPVRLRDLQRRYSATRRRRGDTASPLQTDSRSCRYRCRMHGVCPLGAQVRRTLGMSRNPLSSTKTRWAPRRAAFFYPGPFLPRPAGDGHLVALDRAPLGLLAAPAQRGQHLPDMRGVIAHAELLVNQLAYPRQGPQVGPMPGAQCASRQQRHELPLLGGGQARWTSRGGFGVECPPSSPSVRLPPPKDGTHSGPDLTGNGREGPARLQQLNSAATALLQLLGRSRRSHVPSCRRPLDSYALFMQDSIITSASLLMPGARAPRNMGADLGHCQ
jgi:hypothetical protein